MIPRSQGVLCPVEVSEVWGDANLADVYDAILGFSGGGAGFKMPSFPCVVAQLLHALRYAHAAGVEHNDVHVGNLFVWKQSARRSHFPQVALGDWELASPWKQTQRADALFDCPGYPNVPPERALPYNASCSLGALAQGGTPRTLTPWSTDSWKLGNCIVELATGLPVLPTLSLMSSPGEAFGPLNCARAQRELMQLQAATRNASSMRHFMHRRDFMRRRSEKKPVDILSIMFGSEAAAACSTDRAVDLASPTCQRMQQVRGNLGQAQRNRHDHAAGTLRLFGTNGTNLGFDLLKSMLEWDPQRRITPHGALQHPWFSHVLDSRCPAYPLS